MKICFLAAANTVHTQNWILSLFERNHEVHIITFHNAEIKNINVHYIESQAYFFKINYLLAIPKVKKILTQIRPDLVVGYYLTSYGLIASIAGGHPLVLAAAGSDIYGRFPRSLVDEMILRYALKKADLVFCWAEHMAQRVIALGADKGKTVISPRGIDTRIFFPAEQTGVSEKEKMRIISTRDLKKVYNLSLLIEAVKLIKERKINPDCLILGDGPEKENLFELAAGLGICEDIKFLGLVEYGEIASHLRTADIYISPSLSDGASASLFEAMACGVFPVVTDIPANREWIEDGINGFLVPVDSPEILADKIIQAIQSPDLRSSAREKNIKIVREKASLQTNSKKMEYYFTQLITNNERDVKTP